MIEKSLFESKSLSDTESVGQQIASALTFPSCVYLDAGMGAGKTTLTKSIINSLGYQGEVTSPTYNLIQEYPVNNGMVYHMDLYRLQDPEELSFLALEDLWSDQSIFLIEWPQNGEGYLSPASHIIRIEKDTETNVRSIEFAIV